MLSGKILTLVAAFGGMALVCAYAPADSTTTQPSDATAKLQLQANELLAKYDYKDALPILEKVATNLSDQPDQLGPVMEDISRCKKMMKAAAAQAGNQGQAAASPVIPNPMANQPTDPKLEMGENRVPHPKPVAGQTLDVAIKELGNFEYDAEKGGGIPDDVKHLDGCHIRTHGFMIPLDQAESISEFALVPSLFACCFGQPPQIQHTLVVHCPKGKAVSYFPDELIVEGTLHVSEQKDGGFIVSIFQIDATSVKPMAQ